MNNRHMQKWLDALRSGKFKQANGVLKQVEYEDEIGAEQAYHCCLGVYIEVNHDGEIDRYRGNHSYSHVELLGYELAAEAGLDQQLTPAEVEDARELSSTASFSTTNNRQTALSLLNDETDIGFEGIAKFVEDHGYADFRLIWRAIDCHFAPLGDLPQLGWPPWPDSPSFELGTP